MNNTTQPQLSPQAQQQLSYYEWRLRLEAIVCEYVHRSAYPKWLYAMREVHLEMMRRRFGGRVIRVRRYVVPWNPLDKKE